MNPLNFSQLDPYYIQNANFNHEFEKNKDVKTLETREDDLLKLRDEYDQRER